MGFPQNSDKYKNKGTPNQWTATGFYFLIDLYMIFCHRYKLSDFIS